MEWKIYKRKISRWKTFSTLFPASDFFSSSKFAPPNGHSLVKKGKVIVTLVILILFCECTSILSPPLMRMFDPFSLFYAVHFFKVNMY